MPKETFNLIISEESIASRVKELAQEINGLYKDEPVVALCVLKGAFMFFSDLMRNLSITPEIDFIRLASYGMGTENTQAISFTKDAEISLQGKHVLIIEDIIYTGYTMSFLLGQLAARGAKSLRLVVLIDKQERRKVSVSADFVGFTVPEGFLVGYGIDYAEKYRTLPAIYEIIFD